jgi:hypothetical protein
VGKGRRNGIEGNTGGGKKRRARRIERRSRRERINRA